jgi:tetratricopeptide (TPR) repeat protein
MRLSLEHIVAAAVAVVFTAVAMADGGYHLGFVAGAGFVLWWVTLVAVSLRVWPRSGVPAAAVAAAAVLGLLAAWTALSIAWASDDGAAFVEAVRASGYLGLFAVVAIAAGREGPRPWLAGITAGALAVVLVALATRYEPMLGAHRDLGGRLSYPIGYWNGLAAIAALACTLLAWQAAHARARLARSLATAALPLCGLAIYVSASRGGAITAGLGCLVVLALGPRRLVVLAGLLLGAAGLVPLLLVASSQEALLDNLSGGGATGQGHVLFAVSVAATVAVALVRHRLDRALLIATVSRRQRLAGLVAAALLVVVAVVAVDPSEQYSEFKRPPERAGGVPGPERLASVAGSGRYQFWEAALEAFESQPIRGIGAGAYESWWNVHGSIYWPLVDAHSLPIEALAELGAVGFVIVLTVLALPVVVALRRRAASPPGPELAGIVALLAAAGFASVIDWMWEIPVVFGTFVVAAALATGPATARADPRKDPVPRLRGARWTTLLAALVALAALWSSFDLLLMRVSLDQSRSAAARGDLDLAAREAADAISAQPWAAAPRLQLGLVEQRRGRYEAAREALLDARARAPEDWRILYILNRVESEAGNEAAARRWFRRARALNPRSPLTSPAYAPG